jgi:hypothetical protein
MQSFVNSALSEPSRQGGAKRLAIAILQLET